MSRQYAQRHIPFILLPLHGMFFLQGATRFQIKTLQCSRDTRREATKRVLHRICRTSDAGREIPETEKVARKR